jgi:NADPH2:quinone reductase
MRAIVVRDFGGPEVMRLEELPDRSPAEAEVAVRLRAAGVNPVDAYIRSGTYARKPSLPYVPGLDGAGEVVAVGTGIVDLAAGDRVYFAGDNLAAPSGGTYAEQIVCRRTELHRLPDRISFAQGAAIGVPYVTAYRALFQRAAARPGETVLVHGATGGVGIAAVELAHAHGLTVIASGGTPQGLDTVRAHGADITVNHKSADYLAEVMKATAGRGVDVVLEMAAHLNLDKDLGLLARAGRVVVIGNRGRIEIDPRQAMARDATILGLTLFNASSADVAVIHAALGAGLSLGALNPVVGRELPLAEAPRAHEAVLASGAHGKIVLTS